MASKPASRSTEMTADFIGRFTEAGATEFSLMLYNPAQPRMARAHEQHKAADRDTLASVAQNVFPQFT